MLTLQTHQASQWRSLPPVLLAYIPPAAFGRYDGAFAKPPLGTVMPLLGAHMSIAGGYYKAADAAGALGMNVVQVFTSYSPRPTY